MLLAIDIGNTNIVIGCIKGDEILFNERVSTNHTATDLEYAIEIKTILEIHKISAEEITGAVMSSVVPSISSVVKKGAEKMIHHRVMVVEPGVKTGLRILTDNPAQLGSDLVVDAVAGISEYPLPLVIIDMGTATTVSVISRDASYLGTLIIPGMRTSLDALVSGAAQLPKVKLEMPERAYGTSTAEAMSNGIMLYTASGLDGCIDRIREEMGEDITVVATGGLAGTVISLCKNNIIYDNDLLLMGLKIIYNKNKR